jgi:hypothetical protein
VANRKQDAEARQLGTLETEKNANGKRPLDEEEKAIGDAAQAQKKPKGAAASEHVARPEKTATKSEDAPAAVEAPTTTAAKATTPATAITTPATATTTTATATSKAPASIKAPASTNTASAYTSKATASSTTKATAPGKAPAAPITKAKASTKAKAPSKASASTKPSAARNTSSAARKAPAASKDPSAAKKTFPAANNVVSKTPVAKKAPAASRTSPAASKPVGVRKTPVASKTECAPANGHVAGIMAKVKANAAALANMTPAASKAPVKKATKKATAPSKPRPEAPDPKHRYDMTSKEDTIRPAPRSDAQIAKEKAEAWKRTCATNEAVKNFRPNQKLVAISEANTAAEKALEKPRVQGASRGSRFHLTPKDPYAAPKKARAPAQKASNKTQAEHNAAVVASNAIKALADKTNTAASLKRRSEAAGLDADREPQKKLRRADGTQPARPSGKKTERNENVPQQSRGRTARATEATEEIEEEEAPKRINRKVKKPVPAPNWFSDGEDSEFETVTKEEYAALEEEKKAKSKAIMNGTKRARDEGDEEEIPAPKKAKVVEPAKQASGEFNSGKDALTTGSDVFAATPAEKAPSDAKSSKGVPTTGSDAAAAKPDQVASPPRKKGVARTTDNKNKKADAKRLRRNAKDQAARDKEAAERDAIVRAGGTAVRTESFLRT